MIIEGRPLHYLFCCFVDVLKWSCLNWFSRDFQKLILKRLSWDLPYWILRFTRLGFGSYWFFEGACRFFLIINCRKHSFFFCLWKNLARVRLLFLSRGSRCYIFSLFLLFDGFVLSLDNLLCQIWWFLLLHVLHYYFNNYQQTNQPN